MGSPRPCMQQLWPSGRRGGPVRALEQRKNTVINCWAVQEGLSSWTRRARIGASALRTRCCQLVPARTSGTIARIPRPRDGGTRAARGDPDGRKKQVLERGRCLLRTRCGPRVDRRHILPSTNRFSGGGTPPRYTQEVDPVSRGKSRWTNLALIDAAQCHVQEGSSPQCNGLDK